MRFLVSTHGAPILPERMPSLSIKSAEGFMDVNKQYHTMIITHVAKRVSQIRTDVDKFNQSTDKRMNLVVDDDGLDMIVIFPGKTNYRENAVYKQIAIAKTMGNPTYWSWSAEPQLKKEDVVMAESTMTVAVTTPPAALTVVPAADSTMVAVETSTMVTSTTNDLDSRLNLLQENELVHMENDELNRRFAALTTERNSVADKLKMAQVAAAERDAEHARVVAEFELAKEHLESLASTSGAGRDTAVWKVLQEKAMLRQELDKAFADLKDMQTMRNELVDCCKTLREKLNKHEPPRKYQVVIPDAADSRKRMTDEEVKVFIQHLQHYCENHDGNPGDLGKPLPATDAKYENMMPTLTEMMKKLKVGSKSVPAGLQNVVDSLAAQLCQARDEVCKARNDYDAVRLQLACGTNSAALDGYRQKLLLRKMGSAAPPVPMDVLGLVVSEYEEKCAECSALVACNERLREDMGATLSSACEMAETIAARVISEDQKAQNAKIKELEFGLLKYKQEYEWEYTRRQEYMRELVKMRDLTFLQDFELKTVKEIFDISYGKPTNLDKVPRDQLIARVNMLEGMCYTGYIDRYMMDRNNRIGLALTNVKEWSLRVSERDARIQELARTVRRLERLVEKTGAEVQHVALSKIQADEEALVARCETLRNSVRGMETKEMDMRALCYEVSGDLESIRTDLCGSRKEVEENRSKVIKFQVELEQLTKDVTKKQKECADVETKLTKMTGTKEYAEFQKLVAEINKARDRLLSAQRECAEKLEESKELEAEKISLMKAVEKLEDRVGELKRAEKNLAEK